MVDDAMINIFQLLYDYLYDMFKSIWLIAHVFFKTIILYKIIFFYILKLSMFILVSVDFFIVVLEEVSSNRLPWHVIDYRQLG